VQQICVKILGIQIYAFGPGNIWFWESCFGDWI